MRAAQTFHRILRARAGRSLVVVQNAHGWRVEVVELPAAGRPEKSCHREAHQNQREWKDDEEHTHDETSNVLERYELMTTVSEDSGIKIAAIHGAISPLTASAAQIRL